MALPEDFSKIYGSTATGGLTPISDVNYAKGWEFVGANPPTKNDFSYLQNLSDLKSQWLYSNKLQRADPFGDIKSDGTVNKAIENLGLGEAAKRNVGTGINQIPDMSKWTSLKADFGWRLTPDGFLEQWGRANYGNGEGDFVIPFPNRCVFILISSDPNDTAYAEISQAFPVTNSKFRVGCATAEGNTVNPANLTCNWYAKGW